MANTCFVLNDDPASLRQAQAAVKRGLARRG